MYCSRLHKERDAAAFSNTHTLQHFPLILLLYITPNFIFLFGFAHELAPECLQDLRLHTQHSLESPCGWVSAEYLAANCLQPLCTTLGCSCLHACSSESSDESKMAAFPRGFPRDSPLLLVRVLLEVELLAIQDRGMGDSRKRL